jgi:hypothetical protein
MMCGRAWLSNKSRPTRLISDWIAWVRPRSAMAGQISLFATRFIRVGLGHRVEHSVLIPANLLFNFYL